MIKDFNVGVKGIVTAGGKVLVLKSTQGYWDVPGGRMDGQESIEETLRRELQEELPTIRDFSIGEIVYAHRLSKDMPGGKGLVLLYYRVPTASFTVTLSDEHVHYEWVDKDALPRLLESQYTIEPGCYQALELALG